MIWYLLLPKGGWGKSPKFESFFKLNLVSVTYIKGSQVYIFKLRYNKIYSWLQQALLPLIVY